jgi:glycosyltransferase involved in cell wall biosynthesis
VEEKKVLVITYYWPPSGGSGVQRWLKFVKYLPQYDYTPYVFTPENPAFDVKDPSLERDVPEEAEVIRFPIWEPYHAFIFLSGGKKKATPTQLVATKKQSLFQKAATWIRGNLIIPDPRVFWVRPSVRFLQDFIEANGIKTIVTTGPPHSVHLIGLKLKQKNKSLRWIADFRDPWSEWGLLDSLRVGSLARSRHRALEQKVLRNASVITTITPFYVRRFEKLSGRHVNLLTNGFDEDDFKDLTVVRPPKFVIRHVGIVNEKCDPRPFTTALKNIVRSNPELKSEIVGEFVGEVHAHFRNLVEQDSDLNQIVTFTPPVPHKQLVGLYGNAAMFLLVLNGYKDAEGYLPGKLFEYLATGLPVLGVGPPEGDAAKLMSESGVGEMVDAPGAIERILLAEFNTWKQSATPVRKGSAFKGYSRRSITAKLVEVLDGSRSNT